MIKDKVILVTGGAGFIGSHLCEELVKDNKVYSLDNYFTGTKDNHIKGVTYLYGETQYIENIINEVPDIIYHLGEYSRVEQSFEDIDKVIEYNKKGTQAILEYVRKNKCRLIYAGSSTKFGDNGSNSSPYAWSKASNTEMVINYGEWFNIDYAITYFYNVYGGREIKRGKYATLIAKFIDKVKNNEILTVVSPGTQRRNFTYIDDTIAALLLIGENGSGDGYGIGNNKSYNILEVANLFKSDIEMLPPRDGNRFEAPVLNEKTKELGWEAKTSLEDYINKILS